MSCPSPRATPPDPLVVISANVRAGNVENHSAANSAVAPSYSSDYGSDFTPEEEDLLNALVDKFATEADILKTATPRRLVEARKSTPGFELEPGRGRGGVALNLERRSELAAVVTPDIEASNVFISTLQLGEANSPGGGAAAELSPTLRGILEIWDTLSDFEIESVAGGTCGMCKLLYTPSRR